MRRLLFHLHGPAAVIPALAFLHNHGEFEGRRGLDLDEIDYLNYLIGDPQTEIIGLYLNDFYDEIEEGYRTMDQWREIIAAVLDAIPGGVAAVALEETAGAAAGATVAAVARGFVAAAGAAHAGEAQAARPRGRGPRARAGRRRGRRR